MPDERNRLLLLARAKAKRDSGLEQIEQSQQQQGIPNPFQVLQPGIKQSADNFSSGHWGAGLADFANTVLQTPAVGIEAIRSGVANPAGMMIDQLTGQPIFGTMNKAVAGVADLAGQGLGWLADKAVGMTLPGNNVYKPFGALTPSVLEIKIPEEYTPEYNSVKQLGTMGTTYALGMGAADVGPPMLRGVGKIAPKIVPPEWAYSVAGKLNPFAEERVAAEYGVANRSPMAANYKNAPKVLEKYNQDIQKTVDTRLTPEIKKMDAAGEKWSRKQIADENVDYLKKNIVDENSARGAEDLRTIEKWREDFLKDKPDDIRASEMQRSKTLIQKSSNYGDAGRIFEEIDKGLGHIYRRNIESKSPIVAKINEDLLSQGILREKYIANASKASKNLPVGERSLPFYVAVAEPIRGAALSIGRNLMGAQTMSNLAFGLDKLRGVRPIPPELPNYPPNIQALGQSGGNPLYQDNLSTGSFVVNPGETLMQALLRKRAELDVGLQWRNSPEGQKYYRENGLTP